jgi:hypothetical protein
LNPSTAIPISQMLGATCARHPGSQLLGGLFHAQLRSAMSEDAGLLDLLEQNLPAIRLALRLLLELIRRLPVCKRKAKVPVPKRRKP